MRNYFKGRKPQRKNNLEESRKVKTIVIINIASACIFWLLSILIAGIREYPNSGWVLAGMFLPALLFYAFKKDIRSLVLLLLILNAASVFYPVLEFLHLFRNIGDLLHYPVKLIYAPVFSVGAIAFVSTSYALFRKSLKQ